MLLVTALSACSSAGLTKQPVPVDTTLSDDTTPDPGSCDPMAERLPDPSIIIDSTKSTPTFGVGSYECGGLSGDGYIIFSYNPVLLDASAPVEVVVTGDAATTLAWAGGEPFTEISAGHWKSAAPATGCTRLTIVEVSASGRSNATWGADIRVGGADVSCPQRVIDPSDPAVSDVPSGTLTTVVTP